MFTVRKLKYRPWPITVALQMLGEDDEVVEHKHTFIGHFAPFSEEKFKAVWDEVSAAKKDAVANETGDVEHVEEPKGAPALHEVLQRNAVVFSRILVGWEKVRDEEGADIPFSHEALTAMVTGPDGLAISAGISNALHEIRFGKVGVKNSNTSAKPGPNAGAAEVATNSLTT